jgi:type-F conjugative transfer system pilin assembly protein TrbC
MNQDEKFPLWVKILAGLFFDGEIAVLCNPNKSRILLVLMFMCGVHSLHAVEDLPRISEPLQSSDTLKPIIEKCSLENSKKSELFIFVSFSMSDTSLRAWALQAQRVGGTLVLRGLVENSLKKTVERIQAVFKEHIPIVNIDPVAFKTFGIKVVPAVVIADKAHTPHFDVVYGEVGLAYALRQILDRGEQTTLAKTYLELLGKSS